MDEKRVYVCLHNMKLAYNRLRTNHLRYCSSCQDLDCYCGQKNKQNTTFKAVLKNRVIDLKHNSDEKKETQIDNNSG